MPLPAGGGPTRWPASSSSTTGSEKPATHGRRTDVVARGPWHRRRAGAGVGAAPHGAVGGHTGADLTAGGATPGSRRDPAAPPPRRQRHAAPRGPDPALAAARLPGSTDRPDPRLHPRARLWRASEI